MSDYRCPVCGGNHSSPADLCSCGTQAADAESSLFALIARDEAGKETTVMGLAPAESRRILTHMLNHGSIEDTAADPAERAGVFEVLQSVAYPLFERLHRKDEMPDPRHGLREFCAPGDQGDAPRLIELPLTPMEFVLFRQLIAAARE